MAAHVHNRATAEKSIFFIKNFRFKELRNDTNLLAQHDVKMIENASPHPHSPATVILVARPGYTARLNTTPTAAAAMVLNTAFSEVRNQRRPHQNEDEAGQKGLLFPL